MPYTKVIRETLPDSAIDKDNPEENTCPITPEAYAIWNSFKEDGSIMFLEVSPWTSNNDGTSSRIGKWVYTDEATYWKVKNALGQNHYVEGHKFEVLDTIVAI